MGGTELTISGCKLKFPGKPYRSQIAMMAKIIGSLQRSQNALLESPTGSGKSLALLCSSLAWQESETNKVNEFNNLLDQATANQDPVMRDALLAMGGPGVEMQDEPQANNNAAALEAGAIELATAESLGGGFIPADPDDDDFVEPNAKRARHDSALGDDLQDYHRPPGLDQQESGGLEGPKLLRMPKRKKVPTIYFGTRTHKQVAQIVRELKKTAYSGVRMTILGSREHTCIHPTISRSYNKNQDCQDLMDKRKGGGCRFHHNVKSKLASHASLRSYLGHNEAWDIEDITKVGKKVKACPYFAVRELRTTAQLVICPYNYLVDPKIRKSMEISLNNQVIILDEAHNIEDSAREAVSGTFNLEDIGITLQECERMKSHGILPETHGDLADFCSRLAGWMQRSIEEGKPDYSEFNSTSRVWTGTKGVAEWNELVFAPSSYGSIKYMIEAALKEQAQAQSEQEAGEEPSPALSKKASEVLEGMLMLLEYMFIKDSVYRDDYRMAVMRSQTRKRGGNRGWVGKGENAMVTVITLSFWCLNPAVCFDQLKTEVRSVVLTSGTLSPMDTFASELDVRFPVTLEADHVIDRKQIFAGTLSHGPSGRNIRAVYRNTETYEFQDEIGKLVLGVCQRIPHGVLIFLSSYKMLDNLKNRWQANGTWAELCAKKTIVSEPRFSDQLDDVMREYYEAIVVNQDANGLDGALFMAVCRGKVSEGLDFADNNARAVICVGIPFPNVRDSLVDLKKKYNDKKRNTLDHNILSGNQWYEIQAFRALNQALGRCIRHKKDWGAILMVDDRYSSNERYTNSLSRWVRKSIVHYSNTRDLFSSLQNFTTEMRIMDEEDAVLEAQTAAAAEKSAEKNPAAAAVVDLTTDSEAADNTSRSSSSTAWSMSSYGGYTKGSEAETSIAAKLAKLKDYERQVDKKLSADRDTKKNSIPLLDSQTHLNNSSHLGSGTHLNGIGDKVATVQTMTTNRTQGGRNLVNKVLEVIDVLDESEELDYSSKNSKDQPMLEPAVELQTVDKKTTYKRAEIELDQSDAVAEVTPDFSIENIDVESGNNDDSVVICKESKCKDNSFNNGSTEYKTMDRKADPTTELKLNVASDVSRNDDSKDNSDEWKENLINSSRNNSASKLSSRRKRKRTGDATQSGTDGHIVMPKPEKGLDATISIPREMVQPATASIMDEIASDRRAADSPWADLFRDRRRKKLLESTHGGPKAEEDFSVIPSSPEQVDPWDDDDIIFPSDSELDQYTDVPPKYSVRRPIFKVSASNTNENGDSSRLDGGGGTSEIDPAKKPVCTASGSSATKSTTTKKKVLTKKRGKTRMYTYNSDEDFL